MARLNPLRVLRCCLVPTEAGPAPDAAILDISPHGVGLLAARRFSLQATLTLQFKKGRMRSPLLIPARVAYCDEADNGRWILGCEFLRELTAAEVTTLLG